MVFVIGTYLTIGRILTPLFTILGFLLVYFYSHPKFHREVLWGLGQAIVALGSFYVIAGFLTIKALLISFGTGSLAYVGIKAYRLIGLSPGITITPHPLKEG